MARNKKVAQKLSSAPKKVARLGPLSKKKLAGGILDEEEVLRKKQKTSPPASDDEKEEDVDVEEEDVDAEEGEESEEAGSDEAEEEDTSDNGEEAKVSKKSKKTKAKAEPTTEATEDKPKRKVKQITRAKREVKAAQKNTKNLFPKLVVQRLLRIYSLEANNGMPIQWNQDAVAAAQCAAETHAVKLSKAALLVANHSKRPTVFARDIDLGKKICRIGC